MTSVLIEQNYSQIKFMLVGSCNNRTICLLVMMHKVLVEPHCILMILANSIYHLSFLRQPYLVLYLQFLGISSRGY